MTVLKQFFTPLLVLTLLSSCGILGVHINVHNPAHPGKYPNFTKETILLGELTPIRQNFDVRFYDLDIEIDPDKKKLGGWVGIRATALCDIDSIQLDLDQPLEVKELRWETREGQALKYSRQYRTVYIQLPQKIKTGESFTVHVKYFGSPLIASKPPWAGGLVWKTDKEKNPWIGVACESEGASVWLPCKDHTSDEPDSARLRFTIPDGKLTAVSNGIFMGTETKNNSRSFSWKVSYPINVYNITFYVGNFAKIEDTYTGINGKKLNITHYVLKPNAEKATVHFKQVKEHIRVYEQLYGEYCWYNDGFKLVESPYAGMEHQTAIAYGNGYKNDLKGKEDYIMLHETGHEWFGNAVTVADLADVWLQEGVTTYGEALYLEKKYGHYDYFSHLILYRLMIKNERPVVGPKGRRYFDYHDSDAYVKGAWILHSLRNTIGDDEVFFSIMRTFYEENKLKVTDSKTFIETVNRITGKDYGWFFNQYLYNNKAPFFEYQYYDGAVYYRWTDVSEGFNKLSVPISGGDGNWYEVYPDTHVQKFKVLDGQGIGGDVAINNTKALFGTKKNKKLKKIYDSQK